ncbi:MAG: integrase core domain-containing protein, partial [Acinetobacter baumannii]|nr:integrase core domain-containing protein [Acinetobacter baumannii]
DSILQDIKTIHERPAEVQERKIPGHWEADLIKGMDGKGRWVDNVMVERLWRSVKYEEVYLKAYSNVLDAKKQLNAYFEFYNLKRPHSSLDKMTPDEFYYDQLPQQNKVA